MYRDGVSEGQFTQVCLFLWRFLYLLNPVCSQCMGWIVFEGARYFFYFHSASVV